MEEPWATLFLLIVGWVVVKMKYQCDENIYLCIYVQSYIHDTDKSRMWFVNYYMLCSNDDKDDFSLRNLLAPLPGTLSTSIWMSSSIWNLTCAEQNSWFPSLSFPCGTSALPALCLPLQGRDYHPLWDSGPKSGTHPCSYFLFSLYLTNPPTGPVSSIFKIYPESYHFSRASMPVSLCFWGPMPL